MGTANLDFDQLFEDLTDNKPFPWQRKLYGELVQKQFRRKCDVPTGLGKTSVIAVWLLSLAHHAQNGSLDGFPRRLVHVVNRRTVVDQATREVEHLRDALTGKPELQPVADALRALSIQPEGQPLAISTLRGQFADNAEWRNDPARPAVIVGTVDMVGSRLLFSGYGCGFKSKPLHAGFLGQDVLFIHDEAHLEPPFQMLITAIHAEQERSRELHVFHVMELTATSRTDQAGETSIFTDEDVEDERVTKRLEASKSLRFHPVREKKELPGNVIKLALAYKNSDKAILVFLRELDHVKQVCRDLEKAKQQVQTLTGTLRGLERDELAKKDPIFARFMPRSRKEVKLAQGTVYLVCTSAGEVGVDMSADHMVCDLTPFDSMAQRLGRVNRFGDGEASVDVVHVASKKGKEVSEAGNPGSDSGATDQGTSQVEEHAASEIPEVDESKEKNEEQSPFEIAIERTQLLLTKLPKQPDGSFEVSPAALRNLPEAERIAAFTPSPVICPATDILFDAWALTSVLEKLPGRPPVADWLHGVAEWEPPETYVAWREEVEVLTDDLLARCKPEDLLEDYPLKPHESLRDRSDRVRKELENIAAREPDFLCWLLDANNEIRVLRTCELIQKDEQKKPVIDLKNCTVILPPKAGGLKKGLLDGDEPFDENHSGLYDVAEQWCDEDRQLRRCRVWDNAEPPAGMRLVRTIDTYTGKEEGIAEDDEQYTRRYWYWYARPRSADDDGSRTARVPQDLQEHLQTVENVARRFVTKLGLKEKEPEAKAVTLAAKWHDLGKNRATWQRSIGNHDYPRQVLAKSGGQMRPIDITTYRHEFGSLLEMKTLAEFQQLDQETQDLVLHLVAAHHGRARPHFPADEAFDPDHPEEDAAELARQVPRRFARLQRKYGRWGLAYLESLVRAADALASQALGSDGVVQQANVTGKVAR
ncbi:CRISPR-associated helicase Cas3 [Nitrospira tepida]|uniref:CRISPR-associated helicase Cas3 n=1 Tax=Nitrospira tepida TaxID=2973512 RepID=A0AA86T488_9BACT|nr:type I-U CRISPR-associated helicase/endonuclease Cas3 [Nitrospira tepida]CAI4031436.1 CRISPR-associated helicase Cas3 [Nitrospira tepida]